MPLRSRFGEARAGLKKVAPVTPGDNGPDPKYNPGGVEEKVYRIRGRKNLEELKVDGAGGSGIGLRAQPARMNACLAPACR